MIPPSAPAFRPAPAYGLYPADEFRIGTGASVGAPHFAAIPQARWLFSERVIAIPRETARCAQFDRRHRAMDDLRQWQATTPVGAVCDWPLLVSISAPDVLSGVRLADDGKRLQTADGTVDFLAVSRLPSNRSFYDASSVEYFAGKSLRVRGNLSAGRIAAHSLWPEDFCLPEAAASQPLAATPEALRDYVRSMPHGGFAARLVWQRRPSSVACRAGRPLIGFMLNGAQGDDDEAHGGHFGLLTGRVGLYGAMHDWLMANFYTLATESEKGIIASLLPLEAYLADLNSGQSWYRPSWMLVATLRHERTAVHLSSALARVFNHFYRDPYAYRHTDANCTGICVSTLRALGWQVSALGATSWLKAVAALPFGVATERSLTRGKALFDYLTEDRTRLLPALAFEQAGADLLQLLSGAAKRSLTPFEACLRDDVEAIFLVRLPQFSSSRAWGDCPVVSLDEYRRRLPRKFAERKIIPVPVRAFPGELHDTELPGEKCSRSDYAVMAYAAGLFLGSMAALRRWRRAKHGKAAR